MLAGSTLNTNIMTLVCKTLTINHRFGHFSLYVFVYFNFKYNYVVFRYNKIL